MSLLRTSRYLLFGMLFLLLSLLNVAVAMGEKKFLKGLILGLMLMQQQQKKDSYHHVAPMYAPPYHHHYR